MPSAKNKNAAGLEILLHSPADQSNSTVSQPSASTKPITYRPGSQVTGTVCLTSTQDLSVTSIRITFYGRAKVKILQSNGQTTSEYRSRANFFSYEQRLLDSAGPEGHRCGSGTQTWPFEWTFPSRADATLLRGGSNKKGAAKVRFKPRGEGFLTTEDVDKEAAMDVDKYSKHVAAHELPPTMQLYGRQAWGYVEYVLVATVTESGPGSSLFSQSPKKWISTKVIEFVPDVEQGVVTGSDLANEIHHPMIRTSKLLNAAASSGGGARVCYTTNVGHGFSAEKPHEIDSKTSSYISAPEVHGLSSSVAEDPAGGSSRSRLFSRLSLASANPSSIFSHSSTPRLTLNAMVSYPSIIQVGHPEAIPFHLSITPDLSSTIATSLEPHQLPQVLVKTFSFTIVCCTKTRVDYWKADQKDSKTVNIKLCQDFPVNQIIDLSPPSSLAPEPLDRQKPSINLGAIANLHLKSVKLGRINEALLVPSFATYNIARVFGLKYVVEIEILGTGKTEKIKGEVLKGGITVIAVPDSVRDGLVGANGLPGNDELDLEALEGVDDDDDSEHEEHVEALQSDKVRDAMDEKKGSMKERREYERERGEEDLPRYER